MAILFSNLQMSKSFHICKWISFAILTFVIIEEMASAYSLSTEGHKMKNERIFSTLCWGIVPERVMHDHKREPRNNGYYMRREYNIDLLNEIFLLVNVTLFTGFLRSLPCCCTLIQKTFFFNRCNSHCCVSIGWL